MSSSRLAVQPVTTEIGARNIGPCRSLKSVQPGPCPDATDTLATSTKQRQALSRSNPWYRHEILLRPRLFCHLSTAMTEGYQRSKSLYFPTGDICLAAPMDDSSTARAGDTQSQPTGLIFRVHRFTLSLHSPVFRDIFALPDGGTGVNETYDGVVLVHMPDSAEDLEQLVEAFYYG